MKKEIKNVVVEVPTFVLSFIENRSLYDGSDATEEYFVCRHYQNFTLVREEAFPTSQMITSHSPVQVDTSSDFHMDTDENGDLIRITDIVDHAESI